MNHKLQRVYWDLHHKTLPGNRILRGDLVALKLKYGRLLDLVLECYSDLEIIGLEDVQIPHQ